MILKSKEQMEMMREIVDEEVEVCKSLNHYIRVNDAPEDMFKKIMDIPDSLIIEFFELATNQSANTIKRIQNRLISGENPRDVKLELAEMITTQHHGELAMFEARSCFETVDQKHLLSESIPCFLLEIDKEHMSDIIPRLIDQAFIHSKNEFIQLMKQNMISLNGEKVVEGDLTLVLMNNDVLEIGEKRILRFIK